MSDHDETRELLELAAVEPGGLDRLEAGDAPEAAAVVGHLAGCPECLEEMARLRRTETLLRPILASEPDPALRERTLAFVRAVGVARDVQSVRPAAQGLVSVSTAEVVTSAGAASTVGSAADPLPIQPPTRLRRRTVGVPAWAATLAAALVIGLIGGALLVGGGSTGGDGDAASALKAVTGQTAALLRADDARHVVLVDAAGTPQGSLVISASEGRMLVTATGLEKPAPGTEYRCWVKVGDARIPIGTMRWVTGAAWWSGDVKVPPVIPPGTVYGVSLVDVGTPGPGTVVLTGAL